MAEKAFV